MAQANLVDVTEYGLKGQNFYFTRREDGIEAFLSITTKNELMKQAGNISVCKYT